METLAQKIERKRAEKEAKRAQVQARIDAVLNAPQTDAFDDTLARMRRALNA